MNIETLYKIYLQSKGVVTDTRIIQPEQLFFALKGENFNANTFASHALSIGASFAIIDQPEFKKDERCILVDDVLSTLQQLALNHRKQVNPRAVIAITGSNGKTTTKELVHAVLNTTYKTHYTKGNLNNHIGIPLTLLEMQLDTEIAVIEMGANHQNEIKSYCQYVEPTHGIITNCGKAHMEGFGGVEGIRKGKGELYDYLNENKGTVFVNGDDEILLDMLKQRNLQNAISYGCQSSNTYNSKIIIDNPFLKIQFENIEINSNLFGSYNYSNIMCAVAAGKYFKIENEKIKNAISSYHPENARSQVIEKNGYQLILDSYNANPTSMQHALESFAKFSDKKKIVILGDMFELGDASAKEHQFIADVCEQLNFDKIVLVGNKFSKTKTSDQTIKFLTSEEAQSWFKEQNFSGSEILLKGSRSMKMEKVIA